MAEPLQLEVVVVGAGLGGLAIAIALRDEGHNVTILEAVTELVTAGAGIQVPPPSTRILGRWGLGETVKAIASEPKTFAFRNFRDGRLLGAIPLNPRCEHEYGSPWWTINRADYQKILFEAAILRGVDIKLEHRVTDLDPDGPAVIVSTKGGHKTFPADLIVGADGLRSRIRGSIPGLTGIEPRPTTICAYRALVPSHAMRTDPLRRSLIDVDNPQVDVWLADGHAVLAYPLGSGSSSQYNLVLIHPEKDQHTKHFLEPRFPRPASIAEINDHYANFCSQVRSVLSVLKPEAENEYFIRQMGLAPKDGILEWKLADLPELLTWSSPDGKVVLLGDAAGAQRPYMSAGASSAIEDAVALAAFLKPQAIAKFGIARLVQEYTKLRLPRRSKMQSFSAADSTTWTLPEPLSVRRDELLKKLGHEDRNIWALAMAEMKSRGIGEFNFGDPVVMQYAWSYDVLAEVQTILATMDN